MHDFENRCSLDELDERAENGVRCASAMERASEEA